VHGNRTQGGVGEVTAGAYQALVANPCRKGDLLGAVEPVQVADGDVQRVGDGAGRQLRFVQVGSDECLGPHEQYPPAGVVWHLLGGVEVVGERRGQQVDGHVAQSLNVTRAITGRARGQACQELGEERTYA
jgi:hypothetical protein